ncbi:serine/threonine-protein kinase-like protein At3g51990 [Tasmannia lanceolata]|uniref:serine/threonine-protein kinase-like protein At3g51990 n=1 Tax=Tasmannia lanceolata TaxID=3420 RepID=UPI004063E09A
MGYLSCKAQSSVLTSDSSHPKKPPIDQTNEEKNKRKKKKKNEVEFEKNSIKEFNYTDLENATNGFSAQKLLGKGSHGSVYKGVLHNGKLVAVKKPSTSNGTVNSAVRGEIYNSSSSSSAKITNQVENEIEILSKIQNPSLVNLVGFSNSTKECRDRLLVVEFMSNGTLYDVLHSNPRPPMWARRIRLALQTAKAIQTLHCSTPPIIHRDIKSANVLIDRNYNARLGDFGLAFRCDLGRRLCSTPPAGTLGYLDPSYVTPDNLSTKTDVFSFGILLLEIISGRKAIDIAHSPPSIVDWAIPIIRKGQNLISLYDPRIAPLKDLYVRRQLTLIAAKCVRSCREKRPSMNDVVDCLEVLSKTIPLNLWNNFSVVNNPCLMVDDIGCAIGGRATVSEPNLIPNPKPRPRLHVETIRPMRNSRKVASRSRNLMELMVSTDGESDFRVVVDKVGSELSSIKGLGLRVESGRPIGGSKTHPVGHDLQLRRSQSANCS